VFYSRDLMRLPWGVWGSYLIITQLKNETFNFVILSYLKVLEKI
jgi:hypothetical protein